MRLVPIAAHAFVVAGGISDGVEVIDQSFVGQLAEALTGKRRKELQVN